MFEWAYSGVDHTLPGNGGRECVDFIPLWQRVAESGLACLFAACCIKYSYKRVKLPVDIPQTDKAGDCGKRILLVSMCLTFGIELGFKFATRQFIWIFNPCHVTSMIQIFVLAAPPGRLVTAMFRLHLHMLTGAPIAILFPVINTRLLPFETEVYFLQHFLMMIIPYYLMSIGGVYTPEKLKDMSWALLSLGWLYFFHFVPLNYVAVLSEVNLNNMLCPAVSDPFYGRMYRIFAMGHQVILIPVIGKVIVATSYYFKIAKKSEIKESRVFVTEAYAGRHIKGFKSDQQDNGVLREKGADNSTADSVEGDSSESVRGVNRKGDACSDGVLGAGIGDSVFTSGESVKLTSLTISKSTADNEAGSLVQRNGVNTKNHITDSCTNKHVTATTGLHNHSTNDEKENWMPQENGHTKQS